MRKRSLFICILKRFIEKLLPLRFQLPLRYFYSNKTNKLDYEITYVSNLLKKKGGF